jgi:pyrroline-5-carboxylate reductase
LSGSVTDIVRAVPLPSVARHQGPIALWPAEPASEALFGRIGRVVVVESEAALNALWATTGLVATFYGLADAVAGWLQQRAVAPAEATSYVAALIQAIDDALDRPGATGFADLATSASTRGGLNEQAVRQLAASGWFSALDPTLDGLLRRLDGEIEPPSTT